MSTENLREPKKTSVNILLASVAMLIFGVLSLVFITQMDLQAGWTWDEKGNQFPGDIHIVVMDDINNDGVSEIACYIDVNTGDERFVDNTPENGRIFVLNGKTGKEIWQNNYMEPVKSLFQIFDVDGDGIKDFYTCIGDNPSDWTIDDRSYVVHPIPDQYSNFLVSGINGTEIEIDHGIDLKNFTNYYVTDLAYFENKMDTVEDIICLEYSFNHSIVDDDDYYNETITGYYINGTIKKQDLIRSGVGLKEFDSKKEVEMELFDFNGTSHLLYVEGSNFRLINLTVQDNYSSCIYNESISGFDKTAYHVIEDLDGNGIPEILFANGKGAVRVINGTSGQLMYEQANLFGTAVDYSQTKILEIPSFVGDNSTHIVLSIINSTNNSEIDWTGMFSVNQGSFTSIWKKFSSPGNFVQPYVIDSDSNGDSLNDILLFEVYRPLYSPSEVKRYTIVDALNYNIVYGEINIRNEIEDGIIFSDFDSDGNLDLVGVSDNKVSAITTIPPISLWNSPRFIFGLPLTIICVVFIILGVVFIVWKGRELRFNIKKSMDDNKLTLIVDTIGITLITISFVLFLIQIDIFNFTLLIGDPFSDIGIVFIIVSILWYTLLPLTAAVYNQFSPQFAYFFIKMRNAFFKISKGYDSEILVLDMGERRELGMVNKLKRIILPTLLSIAVGFYTYSVAAPVLGYSQSFERFSSPDFFSFMSGYTLLCTLPMALSFLIFSFLIAGTSLLDDAGISYYRQSKKFRGPGDIEPISYWAQSLIKGIAGLSAIISFVGFFATVDFSGFFTQTGDNALMMAIMGIFIIVVMFWAQPFITSLSYMLLAEDVMDFTHETNVKKLYKMMEKGGYDSTPRKLENLYPLGYKPKEKAATLGKAKEKKSNSSK